MWEFVCLFAHEIFTRVRAYAPIMKKQIKARKICQGKRKQAELFFSSMWFHWRASIRRFHLSSAVINSDSSKTKGYGEKCQMSSFATHRRATEKLILLISLSWPNSSVSRPVEGKKTPVSLRARRFNAQQVSGWKVDFPQRYLCCLHNHHTAGKRKEINRMLGEDKKIDRSGRNQDGNFSQLLACRRTVFHLLRRLIIRGDEEEKHLCMNQSRSSVKKKNFPGMSMFAADLFSVRCVNQRKENICHRFFSYRIDNWLVCTKRNELLRLFFVILPEAKHTLH